MNKYFRISWKEPSFVSCLITCWFAILINFAVLETSESLYKTSENGSNFHENYTLINEIGKGTYSTVYLAKNKLDELVAIKKYSINDEKFIALLDKNGISPDNFIEQFAQKELHIGQLTDHPNIVRVREVFFEGCSTYVVMDYVKGQAFNPIEPYSSEVRVAFMQQFLNAQEHLLLRNIITKDICLKNILISNNTHLTLMHLKGNEILYSPAGISVGYYIEMIERILTDLGGEFAETTLDNFKYFFPSPLRKETISPAHVRVLISWIEELQKKLSAPPSNLNNTFHQDTADKILPIYSQLQSQYSNHISFTTAQHSKFLAYSLIATNVLKKFNPGKYPHSYFQNIHILRYPFDHLPKNLEELFQLQPVREDYDTASSIVSDALISASPSLRENESQESAWGIFVNNERKGDVAEYIYKFLENEKISPIHFRSQIKTVLKETPQTNEGLIYNFFIPKDAPLHKAIYLSEPYGIPTADPLLIGNLVKFYEQYEQGLVEDKNSQLRFLPSALTPENGFDLTQVHSYRFTTIPRDKLEAFSQKIEKVVGEIFGKHLEEMLQLASFASTVEVQSNLNEKQKGYEELCYRHLCRRDVHLALHYWHKINDQNPHKFSCLPGIIACLLKKDKVTQASYYLQQHELNIAHKEQLLVRFALAYIEKGRQTMLEALLKNISDSRLKKFILTLAGSRVSEYTLEHFNEDLENLLSDDELFDLARPSLLQNF